jgi:hypothetical protein
MRRFVRLCTAGVIAGVLTPGTGGAASAQSDNACTFLGEPPGAFVSNTAQTVGHSGTFNPGIVDRGVSGFCMGPP